MKVSLRHIAEEVGVSVSTVSRALAGGVGVNDQTRQRVAEAARRLGYLAGRDSRQPGEHRSLGLLMPEDAHAMGYNTRTWLAQIEGISKVSRPLGWSLVIGTYRPGEASLPHQHIDGALLTRTSSDDRDLDVFRKLEIPFVVLNRSIPDAHCVYVDNRRAAESVAEYLVSLNHRHFAIIAGSRAYWSINERMKGFQGVLEQNGIEFDDRTVFETATELSEQEGYEAMSSLLKQHRRLDAVVGVNDRIAVGAIKAAKDAGVRIPEDLSVIGFDDTISASYVDPPLTTVHIPWRTMAREGTHILFKVMDDDELDVVHVRLNTRLVIRKSTAPKGA